MPRFKDLTNKRFGRLFVIVRANEVGENSCATWLCFCECGNLKVIPSRSLLYGATKSCGCLQKDVIIKLLTKHGEAKTSDVTPEYSAWRNMLQRCRNKKCKVYKYYGGRGIRVCRRWYKFKNFIKDMGRKPKPNLTLERVNNDKGYKPSNCIWATWSQQAKNKRVLK
jgi:hypothetical protein